MGVGGRGGDTHAGETRVVIGKTMAGGGEVSGGRERGEKGNKSATK